MEAREMVVEGKLNLLDPQFVLGDAHQFSGRSGRG
jgi:hypothetical protein